ncbi:MAG: WD40 repeat domain-containing protein [Trichodesmium sp.]
MNTLKGDSNGVISVAVTCDGKKVISGSSDHTIKIWSMETEAEIVSFTGEISVLCCAVATDGMTIVPGELSGSLHFLHLEGEASTATRKSEVSNSCLRSIP